MQKNALCELLLYIVIIILLIAMHKLINNYFKQLHNWREFKLGALFYTCLI